MIARILTAVAAILLVANVSTGRALAQAPVPKPVVQQPPAQAAKPATPPPQVQPPAPRPPAAQPARPASAATPRGAITLVVTDHVGKTLSDIRVALTGAMSREGTTSRDGALTLEGLRPGTYRLRFEAADFITLEREVTVKTGPAAEVDVSLDRAPAKPPEPPAPAQPTNCGSAIPADPNATIDVLSLPDWYGSNQAKDNDPPKETSVGHTAVMTPAVIQVNKQPITNRVRDDADQLLYVIAGQGVIRTRAMERSLGDGFLAIVPRGVTYTLERRGRTPLVVLSVVNK